MVRLLLFEYRKHFFKKSIILAILLFSIVNVAKIYSIYNENSLLATDDVWHDLYWDKYEDFSGDLTNEKIEKLMSIYEPLYKQTADKTASRATDNPNTYTGNLYNDTYFFRWNFVDPMEYAYMYKNYAQDVVNTAKENMELYETLGNEYEYNKNKAIVNTYTGRTISDFQYTEMYSNYTHYDFSALLVLLICMYVLINVFVSEKETEMDLLLLTTKWGGIKTTNAKLITSTIFVCTVCCWFWLLDFIAFAAIFGSLEASFSPIYAIQNFSNTPINLNLAQYALLSSVMKTAGILILSYLFLLISMFFKQVLFPFIISLLTTFALIYLQEMYLGSSHVLLKTINPFVLVMNRELYRHTEFLDFFHYPLPSYISAILFAIAWGIVFILGIKMIIQKNTVQRKRM